MGHLLSQNDLDLLWAGSQRGESQTPPSAQGAPETATGLTQADLDALMSTLGGGEAAQTDHGEEEAGAAGLAQSDLDALWGLSSGDGPRVATKTSESEPQAEPSAAAGEILSQDDIDKLLAEMGR